MAEPPACAGLPAAAASVPLPPPASAVVEVATATRRFVFDATPLAARAAFFAGLLDLGVGGGGAAAGGGCGCWVAALPALASPLPSLPSPMLALPAPEGFELLVPFLTSGLPDYLLSAGEDALLAPRGPLSVCGLLGNALFLGLDSNAVSAALTPFMARHWVRVADADAFSPRCLPAAALDDFLLELNSRAASVSYDPAAGAAALRLILRWARRDGWGAGQHAELRRRALAHGRVHACSPDDLLAMAADPAFPAALLDAVLPAHVLAAVLCPPFTTARREVAKLRAAMEHCVCVSCGATLPACAFNIDKSCPRYGHPGVYVVNQGWSCCNVFYKRGLDLGGCKRIGFTRHYRR